MAASRKNTELKMIRLSDRILYALQLAVSQEDIAISDILVRAMEISMTRNTGGGEFIERREYPSEMEAALEELAVLKSKRGAK